MGCSRTFERGFAKPGKRYMGSRALTGDFPFDAIKREDDVILRIIEGNIPSINEHPYLSQVDLLCKLIKRCWDMDPDRRASAVECRSFVASMNVVVPSDFQVKEGERVRSIHLLQAIGQTHITEGRLGEGLRYLLESNRLAEAMGDDDDIMQCQQHLSKNRRSTHRIETVNEEEAEDAWNMALMLAEAQLYSEAERQLLFAATRYRDLGFQTPVWECEEFLTGLREVIRSLPPRPRIPAWAATASSAGSEREYVPPIPPITHTIYSQEYGDKSLTWFVA
ncbi:hypothetical protein FS837_001189 [Tulasnella sp. UAMH 9824]|nr:hypothetical protein FS837_001189 [Tulasnella sp. UAMH 9824]